jgi:hypothetical protein
VAVTQITVPDEVARLIIGATPPIVLVDSKGQTVGHIGPIKSNVEEPDADVALALQRIEDAKRGGKFYRTEEVIEHLQAPEML